MRLHNPLLTHKMGTLNMLYPPELIPKEGYSPNLSPFVGLGPGPQPAPSSLYPLGALTKLDDDVVRRRRNKSCFFLPSANEIWDFG